MLEDSMKRDLLKILNDDLGTGDITSALLPPKKCRAVIKCNEDNTTLAGVEEASYLFEQAGLVVKAIARDGDKLDKGGQVLEAFGLNRLALAVERTALNVLGRMSGVASRCRRAVTLAETDEVKLMLTRKTSPGFNIFDKKAAGFGGVLPHRRNLSEMVLLKDNHLMFFADAGEAVRKARAACPGKAVEVEAQDAKQALDSALAGADIIMLDNFPRERLPETIRNIRSNNPSARIELSGGISPQNVREFAGLGADYISMGSLTREAKMIDFSLDVEPLE